MLQGFISENREEILHRVRERVAARNAPIATESDLTAGLSIFLSQLCDALIANGPKRASATPSKIERSAGEHGGVLFRRRLTVAQVVHDYGDLRQVIVELAGETQATITVGEFETLNFCLDEAIAGAVTAYALQLERSIAQQGTERLGVLAHEMRNLLSTATLSFASIKKGAVSTAGSTSAIHDRSLARLRTLIDHSLADVRLDAEMRNIERLTVREVIEEAESSASIAAQSRGLHFEVTTVDPTAIVEADRQILAAAVANLLQNAIKFTRRATKVSLRGIADANRVLFEVEDECGGLPPGRSESLLLPFVQRGSDRTGLGLGLAICLKSVTSMGGEFRVHDMPGKGCIFTIDLPRQLSDLDRVLRVDETDVTHGPAERE